MPKKQEMSLRDSRKNSFDVRLSDSKYDDLLEILGEVIDDKRFLILENILLRHQLEKYEKS